MSSIKQRHNLYIIIIIKCPIVLFEFTWTQPVRACVHEFALVINKLIIVLFIVSKSLGVPKHDQRLPLEVIISGRTLGRLCTCAENPLFN